MLSTAKLKTQQRRTPKKPTCVAAPSPRASLGRRTVCGRTEQRRPPVLKRYETKVRRVWGSVLIAAAALKTPTRNGYNAQGANFKFWVGTGRVPTDSSSDSASHTHSARRPSAAAKMPLSGLCALWRCGLACCGRHGERRCAPGAGEKPVAFCRTLVLFSQKENSRKCVWVAGGLSPCEYVCRVQL